MQQDKNPEEILKNGIGHQCDKHRINPFLLNLCAAIHANPLLSELDLKYSRENAALLAAFLKQHFPQTEQHLIKTRSYSPWS